MRNFIFVALFFLGIIHSLVAQQWVEMGFLDTLQIDLALKNKRDVQQAEINKIIRAIAYTHQKPPETVAVSWKVMLSYQVMREDKGQFKSQIFIKPFVPQGNTDLYGIESSAYILPKLTSFRLRIFKEDSSLVYLKYYRNQVLGAESAGEIADVFMWHQRWSKGWYMQADQFVFEFNQAKYTFEEWFQMANNYQAANFLVDQLLKEYDALQLKEQEPLTFLMKSIRQANFLKKLFQQDFYKELVLGKNDPQNLDKKMIKLSTLYDLNIEKYGRFLIQNRQDIRVEDLVNTYLLEDENLIKLKTEYTSIYDDLFTKLIHSNYPSNIAFNDFSFFSLNSNGSSSDYNESLILFETSLFDKSMSKIESLISNQYFTEALYTIDNLESFV
ncbi:MAG: hypothetical protein JW729_10100, partial [Bacteroidales bacterium]|nr:hypothetical protein [Bacteroidales bacterium]